MNKRIITIIKNIAFLLFFISIPFSATAQTELTVEMVWQDGVHWVYPYEIYTDFYGSKLGIYMRECKLEKYYDEKNNDYYLRLMFRDNYHGTWPETWSGAGNGVKVDGNKVYKFGWKTGSNGSDEWHPYLMYDFDTWNEGEAITFESSYGGEFDDYHGDDDYSRTIVLDNKQRIVTDPEGKYFSYSFSGEDERSKTPYHFIKGIGRILDNTTYNLAYAVGLGFYSTWLEGDVYDDILALKVWHPDLGVLYQHPEYDRYIELAGVNSLTADEVGEAVITAGVGEVTIESAQPVEVMICTTTGVTVHRDKVTGSATYPLAPGIYIVRAGSRTCKVCI